MKKPHVARLLQTVGMMAICLALSLCYLLLFSITTSPLAVSYGGDSAFFILVGKGMLHGYIPYRDFFDMKGLWLFFIECFGQMISEGRTGAFVIQVMNLTLTLFFFVRSFDLAKPQRRFTKYLLLLPCAWTALYTVGGGNLTEEFALFPLGLTLFLTLRYFVAMEQTTDPVPFPWQEGLVFGTAFGVLLFSRINNAGLIGAAVLTIVIVLLATKQFACLWKNAVAFLGGMILTMIPVFVYCGHYGIIREMLDQTFLFGFRYSSASGGLFRSLWTVLSGQYRCYLYPLAITVLCPFLNREKYYYKVFATVGTVFTVICIALGYNLEHYYALTIPLIALTMFFLARLLRDKKLRVKAALLVCVLAVLLMGSWKFSFPYAYRCKETIESPVLSEYDADVLDVVAQIPEEDSVYCWTPQPRWYCIAERFPASRCCGWMNNYVGLSSEFTEELKEFLLIDSPDWLVLDMDFSFAPDFFRQSLEERYEEQYRNGSFILYRVVR